MAGRNKSLYKAKNAKQDEFYTELPQIAAELGDYPDKFRGKAVYCNCNDPFESDFVKYFLMNFNRLGLKELIAAGYATGPVRGTGPDAMGPAYGIRVTDTKRYLAGAQKDLDAAGARNFLTAEKDGLAVRLIGNVVRDKNGDPVQVPVKERYTDWADRARTRTVRRDLFYAAGDFRSDMSIALLRRADIVVTNGPFSLFREHVAQLMEHGKQFLILGNMNAITYKEFSRCCGMARPGSAIRLARKSTAQQRNTPGRTPAKPILAEASGTQNSAIPAGSPTLTTQNGTKESPWIWGIHIAGMRPCTQNTIITTPSTWTRCR